MPEIDAEESWKVFKTLLDLLTNDSALEVRMPNWSFIINCQTNNYLCVLESSLYKGKCKYRKTFFQGKPKGEPYFGTINNDNKLYLAYIPS